MGRDGDDLLSGAGASDVLRVGRGGDTLLGGAGADVFLFGATSESAGAGRDVILDFGATDRIGLSAIDADTGRAGDQAFRLDAGGAFRGRRDPPRQERRQSLRRTQRRRRQRGRDDDRDQGSGSDERG